MAARGRPLGSSRAASKEVTTSVETNRKEFRKARRNGSPGWRALGDKRFSSGFILATATRHARDTQVLNSTKLTLACLETLPRVPSIVGEKERHAQEF